MATAVDDELYREIILDHYRRPRHRGRVEPADADVHGHNPLCGDEVDVTLRVRAGRIEAIAFDGQGCSISLASASMMAEQVAGSSVGEARETVRRFKRMLVDGADPQSPDALGDLEALQGVRRYASRVKCAVLAWNALETGLDRAGAQGERGGADA